jgi:hypothetical protein
MGEVGEVQNAVSQGEANGCQGDDTAVNYPVGNELLHHPLRSWSFAAIFGYFCLSLPIQDMIG